MSNAVKLLETEFGCPIYEIPNIYMDGRDGYELMKDSLQNGILQYINYTSIEKISQNDNYYNNINNIIYGNGDIPIVYLNDGSIFFADECTDTIIYDINGEKGPNVMGRDMFRFYFMRNDDDRPDLAQSLPHFSAVWFDPIPWEENSSIDISRDTIWNSCKQNGGWCSALIQVDGWEIKDDYPLKL